MRPTFLDHLPTPEPRQGEAGRRARLLTAPLLAPDDLDDDLDDDDDEFGDDEDEDDEEEGDDEDEEEEETWQVSANVLRRHLFPGLLDMALQTT